MKGAAVNLPLIRKPQLRLRWSLNLVGLMLLGIALNGCSGQQPQPGLKLGANTLNVARTALAGGNPKLALNIANAVLKTNPNNLHARLARGDAFYLLGNCTRASADYHAALRQQPGNANAELGLGRCALPRDPRLASVNFEHAIHDAPNNAIAFNDLGIAEAAQSQFRRASNSFRKALTLAPSLRAAKINLGMSLTLGGHPAQAELILGPLARGAKSTPKIRADYATALALTGNITGAETELHHDMPDAEARSIAAQLTQLAVLPTGPFPVPVKSN